MFWREEEKMRYDLWKKELVVGIIVLFVGTCIIPSTGDFTVSNGMKKGNVRDSPPDEEWNRTYSAHPPGDYSCGYCIKVTPDGGYIVTGYSGSDGSYSVYLLKVDNQGNELWNRTFGSGYIQGNWVEITSDNGYIITGRIGYENPYSNYVWLIKTDANGNEEWNRTFGGLGNWTGYCVKQTMDGGYILTGMYWDYDSHSLLLIKTDALGNVQWYKTYGNHSGGYSLAHTTDGRYIVTGVISYNLGLMKIDENGTVEWEREFSHKNGRAVQQTSDGGYIVGGQTSNDSGNGLLLMKTDENGVEQWNRTFYGSGSGFTVIQTVDGDYILGGTPFRLTRTHPDGNVVWDHFYLPSSQNAQCYCVQQTPDNGFIATGVIDLQTNPKCVILKLNASNNHPPSSSTIEGPHWGVINESYQFCINATDPDGDALYCTWEWGDGNITDWLGPYSSNVTVCASHAWSQKGTYEIRVKLKDKFGHESNWSDPYVFNVYELKNAFLFGRYTNMTTEGDYRTVEAVNLRMILLRPVQYFHYIAGEKITFLQNNSKVFITPRFIIGMVDAVI